MTLSTPPAVIVISTACGILAAAATGVAAHGLGFVAAIFAVIAVLAGTFSRPAATLAVLLIVTATALNDPSPLLAALSGASATAYLVLRHAIAAPRGLVTVTKPTMIAAIGFTLAAIVAASLPLQLPWVPLLSPVTVVALYVLTTRPFITDQTRPVP